MFDKTKNIYHKYRKHPAAQELKDVRVLGLIAFCVIVVLVSWSGVRVIETNYKLQQQIARMEEETKVLELENTNKELENKYYESDRYLELQARRQFSKAAPGETVVLVPESVALKHTVEISSADEAEAKSSPKKPFYQENFEAWMNFFFRRNTIEI